MNIRADAAAPAKSGRGILTAGNPDATYLKLYIFCKCMDEKILVYGLVVFAIILLAWTVAGALRLAPVAAALRPSPVAAVSTIGTDDVCKMPDGYPGGGEPRATRGGPASGGRIGDGGS